MWSGLLTVLKVMLGNFLLSQNAQDNSKQAESKDVDEGLLTRRGRAVRTHLQQI